MSQEGSRRGPGGMDGNSAIRAVSDGSATPAELHADSMRRIAEWEPGLGAIVETIDYRPPHDGPLRGMILGVKTQIEVAGHRNWFGLQAHGMDATPVAHNATVVQRLLDAGATLSGTTAAPFVGAPGGVTPQTGNARCEDRVSGGSSGGSASAIAAGIVHGALGSDSGGSIRIPSACCGVVGLQTTRGLAPLNGAGGLTFSMDNVGPMASSVADARMILAAIAGYDPLDPYSVTVESRVGWDGEPLRIGLPVELTEWNIDKEVAAAFADVVMLLQEAGHMVELVSLPILRESMALGPATIGIAESGAVIEDQMGQAVDRRPELRDLVRRASEISGPTVARAYHRVAVLRSRLRGAFEEWDLLLTPTLACRVPARSTSDVDPELEVGGGVETRTSALTRLVNPWNLAAVPAGSLPVSLDKDGGPISVQVIGPQFSEWKILDVMESIESALGGPWDTVAPSDELTPPGE